MKVVYVAGPFRAPNAWEIERNIRRAEETAMLLIEQMGIMPMIPHANTRFFHGTQTDQFWLDGTMELLRRCDAVFLGRGWERSSGSKAEKAEAERLKIPVFTHDTMDEMIEWYHTS